MLDAIDCRALRSSLAVAVVCSVLLACGNTAQAAKSTSTPVIRELRVTSITPTSAVVEWSTSVPTDGIVFWTGTIDDYIAYGNVSPVVDAHGTTFLSVTLKGLRPDSSYMFGLRSRMGEN